jgi:hypothetical protein
MRTNQHIVGAGKLTRSFQFGSDLAVVSCRLDRKRQSFEAGDKLFNRPKVLSSPGRFLDTVIQFGERDRRYAYLLG